MSYKLHTFRTFADPFASKTIYLNLNTVCPLLRVITVTSIVGFFLNDDRSAASSSKNIARLCVTLLLKSSNDIDVAVVFTVCSVPFALAVTVTLPMILTWYFV